MNSIQAILFDLDGVLIDSYHLWFHLLNHAAREFAYPPISMEHFHPTWGQGIEADIQEFFPSMQVEPLSAFFEAHYEEHMAHLRVMPGAAFALKGVRAGPAGRQRVLGCITNSQSALARAALQKVALLPLLDDVLGADEAGCSKPEPGGVLALCRRLSVAPAEALMVGDSRFDAEAASSAGVEFLGIHMKEYPSITSLLELPDWLRLK